MLILIVVILISEIFSIQACYSAWCYSTWCCSPRGYHHHKKGDSGLMLCRVVRRNVRESGRGGGWCLCEGGGMTCGPRVHVM